MTTKFFKTRITPQLKQKLKMLGNNVGEFYVGDIDPNAIADLFYNSETDLYTIAMYNERADLTTDSWKRNDSEKFFDMVSIALENVTKDWRRFKR